MKEKTTIGDHITKQKQFTNNNNYRRKIRFMPCLFDLHDTFKFKTWRNKNMENVIQ